MPTLTLNQNLIYTALFNTLLAPVLSGPVYEGNSLVDKAKIDVGMYGDQKPFYNVGNLKVSDFDSIAGASNLLDVELADSYAPETVVLNIFKQIRLTTENYLSKQAMYDEGFFSKYMALQLAQIEKTKRIYEDLTYNAFIGTEVSTAPKGTVSINVTSAINGVTDPEQIKRISAQTIAKGFADLECDMATYTANYNELGIRNKYNREKVRYVLNQDIVNDIRYMDLPTIYHNDGLLKSGVLLPGFFFGDLLTSNGTADGTTVRSMLETDYTVNTVTTHVLPGDVIPNGASYVSGTAYISNASIIGKAYIEDDQDGGLPPFLVGETSAGEFINPRSKTTNHYLTFGHNTLKHLKGRPWVTIVKE